MKRFLFTAVLLLLAFGLTVAGDKPADDNATATKEKTEMQKYVKRQADNPEIAIQTNFGTMTFELYRDVAPGHVDSMLARAREGFYDGRKVFRIIKGFMMQTGDPKDQGTGNAGYYLKAEFSDIPHERGILSMARAQDINSASCQFFVVFGKAPYLDGKYTVFGKMMSGDDVLSKIENVQVRANPMTGEKALPVNDVIMEKMIVLKDIKSAKLDEPVEPDDVDEE
jgi:cyclophilin family peptidyl-prolyl cis-trans isomerase